MKYEGFIGPTYTGRAIAADSEKSINLYPERIESPGGNDKADWILVSKPGLASFATLTLPDPAPPPPPPVWPPDTCTANIRYAFLSPDSENFTQFQFESNVVIDPDGAMGGAGGFARASYSDGSTETGSNIVPVGSTPTTLSGFHPTFYGADHAGVWVSLQRTSAGDPTGYTNAAVQVHLYDIWLEAHWGGSGTTQIFRPTAVTPMNNNALKTPSENASYFNSANYANLANAFDGDDSTYATLSLTALNAPDNTSGITVQFSGFTLSTTATGSGGGGIMSPADLAARFVADMTGLDEDHPFGVPSTGYAFYSGPYIVNGNTPGTNTAMLAWGGCYPGTSGGGVVPANTRVNVRNIRLYWYNSFFGEWPGGVFTSSFDGGYYAPDFSSGPSGPLDLRTEPDGTLSFTPVSGSVAHFYTPYPRLSIVPAFLGGVIVLAEARLILDNPLGADNRASADIILLMGADYYPAETGPGMIGDPGVGGGKAKKLTANWRSFAFTTNTLSDLTAWLDPSVYPPTIDLTGVLP
jgi:hypothetical protein